MTTLLTQAKNLEDKENASTEEIDRIVKRAGQVLADKKVDLKGDGIETPTQTQPQETAATGVSLSKGKVTLGVKETFQLTAAVNPTGASQKVTFSSSKKSVAAISQAGKITAKKTGKAVITATAANGKQASCTVVVKKAPKRVTLNAKTKSLKKGKTFKIKVRLAGAASNQITYRSNKPKVASVSKTGKVTAKKKGSQCFPLFCVKV